MQEIVPEETYDEKPPTLMDKVARFNKAANQHQQKQALNPFSTDQSVGTLEKRRFSKEEYGRPEKGSLSEFRAIKANLLVYREILQLCEVINSNGELLFSPREKQNDQRKVISFGQLFDIYTTISSKLVGDLLRARKHKMIDFEGEVLFQRRDEHIPIVLNKPIEEVRQIYHDKVAEVEAALHQHEPDLIE